MLESFCCCGQGSLNDLSYRGGKISWLMDVLCPISIVVDFGSKIYLSM